MDMIIRKSPSGPKVSVLVPPSGPNLDPNKYLNEVGDYATPIGGGGVSSVVGINGIEVDPNIGSVVVDGGNLLRIDGSSQMTGNLDLGNQEIVDAGEINGVLLSDEGAADEFLNGEGNYVSVSGGSAKTGVELFSISIASQHDIIWAGGDALQGKAFLAVVIPSTTTSPVDRMACVITALPATAGKVTLGIYDANGILLARTAPTTPVLGVNTIPLTVGAGITLNGATQYYIAVASNATGARFVGSVGLLPGTPSISLAFSVPNAYSLDISGLPVDVSVYKFSAQTTARFWAIVGPN